MTGMTGNFPFLFQYKDAFMKANPGYKWCPTTNKPVKTQTSAVTNRKKLWAFASDAAKDLPSPRKATKSEEMPQLNFGMAGEISIHVTQTQHRRFV